MKWNIREEILCVIDAVIHGWWSIIWLILTFVDFMTNFIMWNLVISCYFNFETTGELTVPYDLGRLENINSIFLSRIFQVSFFTFICLYLAYFIWYKINMSIHIYVNYVHFWVSIVKPPLEKISSTSFSEDRLEICFKGWY